MAKKVAKKKTAKRKSAAKRELISPRGDALYIRRDAKGRIKESDDVARSQRADRARKAKRKVKSGQGDSARSVGQPQRCNTLKRPERSARTASKL